VDDDGVGQRCIEYIKSRNAGRATFLPLTEMDERPLPPLPDHEGVIDFAFDLVEFDPEYAGVFSYVLGDTVVVEDLETAREFMGQFRLVTLEGDLVEQSGAMTGGSTNGSRYSFAGSEGALERVATRITELEETRADLRADLRDVQERLDDARDKESEAAQQVRDIQTDVQRKESAIASLEDEIDSLERQLEEIEAERATVSEQMSDIEAEIETTEERIADIEAEIDELQAEIEDSELSRLTAAADTIEGEIDELEDDLDDLDASLNELQLEKRYAEEAIEDLDGTIENAEDRIDEAEERIDDLEEGIAQKEAVLEEKEAAVAELEAELADLKGERETLRSDLVGARERRDEQKDRVQVVESDLGDAREEAERLEWEIDELESAVGDYDPADVPDHDEVQANLERLEAEMTALEPVNMLAIEEYDDVAEDLAELEDRKAVLVEEANAIRDRIQTYEARKKETFMDAFESINAHFEDIFQRLSNGTGHLHLEDEADPFEGGLTMKAQPGDKPIQRLDAMSGGEKSLTALAFIFAIQRHNPAPFYALDEIDAFLDAANAELVGELVDELAGDAQFVVVSHRSAMLERSERAIGVTMEENNISAVTGIDLSGGEAEVPADD
jgi:chromosome segregation protein